MTVRVKFFAYFRDVFGGREREVAVDGSPSVRDLLAAVADTPARRAEIFAGDGLKAHLVVMVNGVHVHSLQGLETRLAPGDTVAVFPFLGGG